MATGTIGKYCGGPAGRDGADVSAGRPALVHHVVARHGDNGLEVLRMPLEGKGEALLVFSARWAARQYLSAEAPGGGWYARACPPDEMISLLAGPCAGVEWVALDPMPGRRSVGELANVMPRENFVHYLLCSRAPFLLRRRDFEIIGDAPHGRENAR